MPWTPRFDNWFLISYPSSPQLQCFSIIVFNIISNYKFENSNQSLRKFAVKKSNRMDEIYFRTFYVNMLFMHSIRFITCGLNAINYYYKMYENVTQKSSGQTCIFCLANKTCSNRPVIRLSYVVVFLIWANLGIFFIYFRHFLFPPTITVSISTTRMEKSVDGVLGIRTCGRRMVGADKTMDLWLPPSLQFYLSRHLFSGKGHKYHYGGVCCLSCRAFFLRASRRKKNKDFRCTGGMSLVAVYGRDFDSLSLRFCCGYCQRH